MRNECHAELELHLGSGHQSSSVNSDSTRLTRVTDWFGNTAQHQHNQEKQQQFTIFYDGKICVCDVTEIQARAIICMARKGMEEKIIAEEKKTHQGNNIDLSPATSSSSQYWPPSPPAPQMINPGLSMKRSLQRFLQKRKMRMDDASPYRWRPT